VSTKWHLLKYVADLRRGENINVGIVLEHEGAHTMRFRDVENGNALRAAKSWCNEPKNYEQWIKHFKYHIAEYGTVEIEPRAGENYRLVPSGEMASGGVDPVALIDELYELLVTPPKKKTRKRTNGLATKEAAA
jgi:hypothetical protein